MDKPNLWSFDLDLHFIAPVVVLQGSAPRVMQCQFSWRLIGQFEENPRL